MVDAGVMDTSTGGYCDEAAQQLRDCGTIDNVGYAELTTACNTGAVSAAEQMALVSCVTSGANCTEKTNCVTGSTEPPETCVSDDDCDTTRGDLTHEICFAGTCDLGCRDDFDCGDSSYCETTINQCVPEF